MAGIKVNDSLMECTLPEIGIDSLTSVELRQMFQRKFGIALSASDTQDMTIGKLIEIHAQICDSKEANV